MRPKPFLKPAIQEVIERYPWDEMLRQEVWWMDRYGRQIKISRMSTRYINNVVPFVQRACWAKAYEWMGWIGSPLGPQGDAALDSLEMEIDRMMDCDVPLMMGLQMELARRETRPRLVEKILDRFRK